MSQVNDIVDYVRENGSITTMQAFGLGITRLASRMHDLRRLGFPVSREMVTVTNRKGELCRVARYTMPGVWED